MNNRGVWWGLIIWLILSRTIFDVNVLKTYAAENLTPMTPVIINELAWSGSSSSTSDEWIELKNLTNEVIDISGWQISKLNDTTKPMVIIPANSTIPANGYFLISHFDASKSVLAVEPNLISPSISLSNSNLQIKLYKGDWTIPDNLIDTAGNGELPLAGKNGINGQPKISMERNAEILDGTIKSNWHDADGVINLDENVNDLATPLSENSIPEINVPIITKINPNIAEQNSLLSIEEITGENFCKEGITQLIIERGNNYIEATDVNVASATVIDNAKFDLTNAEIGNWDLKIINPDGQQFIFVNGIEVVSPTPPLIYSNDIELTELYPQPDTGSDDEFIELHNKGTTPVNIKGWQLDDEFPGGSNPYTIIGDAVIAAGGYLTFTKIQTKISLNDSGDYVRLIQPNGNVLEVTPNYQTARSGQSFSKNNGAWSWSRCVTKNEPNIMEVDTSSPDFIPAVPEKPVQKIKLIFKSDEITTDSVLLRWTISPISEVDEVRIYVSETESERGKAIVSVAAKNKEYLMEKLQPGTQYFFTAVCINEDNQEITSQQIDALTGEITYPGKSQQIVINELLPNPPTEEQEFIELYNPQNEPTDISGWKLSDASKKTYIISGQDLSSGSTPVIQKLPRVIIPSKQYMIFKQNLTGIKLNNFGGEEIYLMDGTGTLIDQVGYTDSAKVGYVYALNADSEWVWSDTPTPGSDNQIATAAMEKPTTVTSNKKKKVLPDTGIENDFWFWWGLIIALGAVIIGKRNEHNLYYK